MMRNHGVMVVLLSLSACGADAVDAIENDGGAHGLDSGGLDGADSSAGGQDGGSAADEPGDVDGMDGNGNNQRPFATNDTATTAEDAVLDIAAADLLANDIGDGALRVIGVRTAFGGHGSAAFGSGVVRFTPELNYHGPAFFTYIVTDGVAFASGLVDVIVTAVNDAPFTTADLIETSEDIPVAVLATSLLANDVDPDDPTAHQPLTLTSVGDASHGTVALSRGVITFVPEPNYNGPASFMYEVSDGVATDQGFVTVNVRAINDAPVAVNDTGFTTAEETPLAISVADLLANDHDVDVDTNGQVLRVLSVSSINNHTVVLANGIVTFTPSRDFNGTAVFTYALTDGFTSTTGAVSVLVTPVNDPPTSVDRDFSARSGITLTISVSELTRLASDIDHDAISFAGVSATSETHGTVVVIGNDVKYTPDNNFVGLAKFEFSFSDGSLTGSAMAFIRVTLF